MNFFEKEMRKICGGIPCLRDPLFMDKSMMAKLDEDLRVKVSFVTCGVHESYEALQIKIINRTDGTVDVHGIKFKELLGLKRSMAIENYGDGTDWGIQKPTAGNYETITAFLNNYISMYAPSLEQEETPEMTGQSM